MRLLWLVVFFVAAAACTPQEQSGQTYPVTEDSLPVFQLYGELLPTTYVEGDDTLTHAYGFRMQRIAGCEVDGIELKKVHAQNKAALKAMRQRHGKNWQQQFEQATGKKLLIPID